MSADGHDADARDLVADDLGGRGAVLVGSDAVLRQSRRRRRHGDIGEFEVHPAGLDVRTQPVWVKFRPGEGGWGEGDEGERDECHVERVRNDGLSAVREGRAGKRKQAEGSEE